jgi:tRNA uridine 5-carbamoylmethylation protein Kti12
MDKKVDVINKYNQEILDIKNKLNKLERGRVYELSNVQMDGYLATNIEQLRRMIRELIYKIEYGQESISDKISEAFNKIDL